MTQRSVGIAVAMVGMIGVSAAAAWWGSKGPDAETVSGTATPQNVVVTRLEPVDRYVRRHRYTGVIRAPRAGALGFERGGRVLAVAVEAGDHVTAGQVLAELDQRKLDAARAELEAQLRETSAALDEARQGPRQQTIAAARARLNELSAIAELARLDLSRQIDLDRNGATSREALERTQYQFESASARQEAAAMELDELEAGTRPEKLAAAQAAVDRLAAALADLELQTEDCTLRAPYAGRIASRHIHEGTMIAAGEAVLELMETDRLEVWIGVPIEQVTALPIGSTVELEVLGQAIPATVARWLPQLDTETRTSTVVLTLETPASLQALSPIGQLARLELSVEEVGEGVWVPISALAKGPRGLWSLYAAEPAENAGHRVVRIDVEVLHSETDRAFVRGPFLGETLAITEGTHRVVPGQQVAPQLPGGLATNESQSRRDQ